KVLGIGLGVAALLALTLGSTVFADAPEEVEPYAEGCYPGQGWHGELCSEAITDLLGLTHEEVWQQLQDGKSLVEIAAAQGVTEDELVGAITIAQREAVQSRVEAGVLTQEQANFMLQQMEQRIRVAVNTAGGFAGVNGHCGYGAAGTGLGYGMMHGWGNGTGTGYGMMGGWNNGTGYGGMMGGWGNGTGTGYGGMMGGRGLRFN
ncbi:MAG: DUF2680 domain-containing protein, partial [Dehalococcoidales bacterium]|nr:DUF2680 domain-containing protein [Dehalococcoidales bacterium]